MDIDEPRVHNSLNLTPDRPSFIVKGFLLNLSPLFSYSFRCYLQLREHFIVIPFRDGDIRGSLFSSLTLM